MDMVSNFLSLITVREIGVREAERGRNPKPQKRMKTFLHSISTMRKSNSPSTQPSAHPIWSPTLGRRWKKRHFREVTGVRSVFMTSCFPESLEFNMASSVTTGSSGWRWAPGKLSTNNYFSASKGHWPWLKTEQRKEFPFPTLFSPPPDKCIRPSPQVHSFSWP